MEKPLLSICIPTYNRAEYLVKSIESIIDQEEFKLGQVEIVISDNASEDDTENVVKQYTNEYENIIYYRNTENIGNDNFPFVLSKGNGILRRLCNDTLCFKEGALKYICNIIKEYKKTKPFICWLGANSGFEIKELDFRNGIKAISYWITSIACFSIWDDECVGIEKDTYGAELLLWQVRKTLELSCEKDKVVIINKSLTITQSIHRKNISYGLFHVFYENYFKLLAPYFENGKLTVADKDYLEKDLLLNFFPAWCAKWKLQTASLQYSESEDLWGMIYQQFHDKTYWRVYLIKLYKVYWEIKVKEALKKFLKRIN